MKCSTTYEVGNKHRDDDKIIKILEENLEENRQLGDRGLSGNKSVVCGLDSTGPGHCRVFGKCVHDHESYCYKNVTSVTRWETISFSRTLLRGIGCLWSFVMRSTVWLLCQSVWYGFIGVRIFYFDLKCTHNIPYWIIKVESSWYSL
jgi:hypothetical protein